MSAPNKEGPFGFHVKLQQGQDPDTANACSHSGSSCEEPQWQSEGKDNGVGVGIPVRDHQETTVCEGGGLLEVEGEAPLLWRQQQKGQKRIVGCPIPTTITGHQ